jgi:hypothetical protein
MVIRVNAEAGEAFNARDVRLDEILAAHKTA